MMKPLDELEAAWSKRDDSEAIRVFHGPGEGKGWLAELTIDRFGTRYWIGSHGGGSVDLPLISKFLRSKGAKEAVVFARPKSGEAPDSALPLFGEPSSERFTVSEGKLKFRIQLLGTKHSGLFLDHEPLRRWLASSKIKNRNVLNAFSYTGSLSVACGMGGAEHVTSLDLSKPALEWAKENWDENALDPGRMSSIAGDYFDRMARWLKSGTRFDAVILDPPSFSRSKSGVFSTSKDLGRLHEAAFSVLAPGGILATSINSANIPRARFEKEVLDAAKRMAVTAHVLQAISLPPSFPARTPERRYLKGLILERG